MNIELRHLRCLVALDDERSFTDAAIALGISQAAVSRTLIQLERGLDAALVRRTTRSVELTDRGLELARSGREILRLVEQAGSRVASGPREVRIGYAWSGLGRATEQVRREWAARHPDTGLRFVRSSTPDGGLGAQNVDVAILRAPRPTPGIEWALVGSERRVCVVATEDPWTGPVSLATIATRTVAVDRRTGSTTESLWSSPAPRLIDTSDVDEWHDVIASGAAVGVTSEGTVFHHPRTDLRYLAIPDAPPVPVALAWRRDDSSAVPAELLALIIAAFGDAAATDRLE